MAKLPSLLLLILLVCLPYSRNSEPDDEDEVIDFTATPPPSHSTDWDTEPPSDPIDAEVQSLIFSEVPANFLIFAEPQIAKKM